MRSSDIYKKSDARKSIMLEMRKLLRYMPKLKNLERYTLKKY
jgi:hypothetical protein